MPLAIANRPPSSVVSHLAMILRDGTVLVSGNDVLVEVAPRGDGGLALLESDSEEGLIRLRSLNIVDNREHDDGTQVTHSHFSDAQQERTVLRELDALDSGGELPGLQASSGPDLPELDSVVGRAGGEEGGGGVDVDGPEGSLVAIVCAQSLAINCTRQLEMPNSMSQVANTYLSTMRTQRGPWRWRTEDRLEHRQSHDRRIIATPVVRTVLVVSERVADMLEMTSEELDRWNVRT